MSDSIQANQAVEPASMPWVDAPDSEAFIWRHPDNPVIERNVSDGIDRVYNSAVIPWGNQFAGVFRADHGNGLPYLHRGFSEDGLNWAIDAEPIDFQTASGAFAREMSFAYDPRVIPIEGRYYIVWCTGVPGPTVGLGVTKDFETFERIDDPVLPFNRNGVLFPRKVNGKYLLLSRPSDAGHTAFGNIFMSESPDLVHWGRHREVMKADQYGWWESIKLGGGPAPIETEHGWLLIYHAVMGTCNGFVYHMAVALLDRDDPAHVISRSTQRLMSPEMGYETTGTVPNVVFPCSALTDPSTGRIAIYYGAADTVTCVAYTTVEHLMAFLREFGS